MARAGLKMPKLPSRDALLGHAWSRPFARHLGAPALWRWNRRSVARGVALGLFVGIMVPLVQSPIAALFSVLTRTNLPVAVVATLITNPLTTPVVLYGAYRLGSLVIVAESSNPIFDADRSLDWLQAALSWLAMASLPTALGLFVMASLTALAGYGAVQLAWRWRVGRRWTRRAGAREQTAMAQLCGTAV